MMYDSQSVIASSFSKERKKGRCSRFLKKKDAPLVMHVLSMAHSSFTRKSRQLKMEKYLHRVKPGIPDL